MNSVTQNPNCESFAQSLPFPETFQFPTAADLPSTGQSNALYLAQDTGYFWRWNGSDYEQIYGPGEDAYHVALRQGFNGSINEWLASLVGPAGPASTIPGPAGPSVNIQISGGFIQWQHDGDSSWTNLIALSSLAGTSGANGTNGVNGRSPEIQVSGGYIQWRLAGSPAWINLIAVSSLVGSSGGQGGQGVPGVPGRSVNLRVSGGYIQWQHDGDLSWGNLVPLSSLMGLPGTRGIQGTDGESAQIQVSGGFIQWKLTGESTWTNLVPLESITGPQGLPGRDGADGLPASLFPVGSSVYADGGTAANPARYIVKNPGGTVIGYVNLSWDGSPLVLVGTEATDASGTALTHGTYALYYDGSGNLTSAVCTN